MLSQVSLHFLIFQSLPPNTFHLAPRSVTGSPASVCCAAFCASTKSSPASVFGPPFGFYRFCRKCWSDMTCTVYPNLHCFSLAFAWLKKRLKTNEDQPFKSNSPLSVSIQKRHCIWGTCSIIAEVISAFSARSCACVPSARECNKIRWRFGLLERLQEAATTLTFEKPASERGTANYITWLTWHEVLSCMKFLGDGREHLFQQLFILWTWHLDLDLLDLEDSTDDLGTVSLGFNSFSYMDTTCTYAWLFLIRMLLAFSF